LLKRQIGVPASVLEEHGAVSREAAEALATAVRGWAGTDIGLAETGIAGPGGAGADRPAGLFWIALADSDGVRSERFVFDGDRVGEPASVRGGGAAAAAGGARMSVDSTRGRAQS